MRALAIIVSSLALIGAMPAAPAGSMTQRYVAASPITDFSSAKHHKRTRSVEPAPRYRHGPGTIACTRAGCQTVPPGCHAVRERTVDGSPSGFQIIVC